MCCRFFFFFFFFFFFSSSFFIFFFYIFLFFFFVFFYSFFFFFFFFFFLGGGGGWGVGVGGGCCFLHYSVIHSNSFFVCSAEAFSNDMIRICFSCTWEDSIKLCKEKVVSRRTCMIKDGFRGVSGASVELPNSTFDSKVHFHGIYGQILDTVFTLNICDVKILMLF